MRVYIYIDMCAQRVYESLRGSWARREGGEGRGYDEEFSARHSRVSS